MHATILAYMFSLVELGRIKVPLGPVPDNTLYVQEFVARLLKTAFPHLTDNQIKITVQGLFNLNQDIPAFKEHLRDFLVEIRVSVVTLNFHYYIMMYNNEIMKFFSIGIHRGR